LLPTTTVACGEGRSETCSRLRKLAAWSASRRTGGQRHQTRMGMTTAV
jgi:hypothetical protein